MTLGSEQFMIGKCLKLRLVNMCDKDGSTRLWNDFPVDSGFKG